MKLNRGNRPLRTPLDVLTQAALSSMAHPLRSALSIVAIATAVATITLVLTGLDAFQRFARETSARAFGSDTFVLAQLLPGQLNRTELANKLVRNPALKRSEVAFLEKYADRQVLYSPIAQRRADVVAGSRKFEGASVNGTAASMFRIRDLGLARGRFFQENEARAGRQVAILGAEVAEKLFPGNDPMGKIVRLGGRGFRVIGLQKKQGSAGGMSLDRYVWIPIAAYERLFGAASTLQVFGKAVNVDEPTQAEDRARVTMRARRKLRPGAEDNFDILSPEAARTFVQTVSERISAAGVPISAMALLAAIIVVTNTSLVSVTQQTREIGVRRAVGASRGRILVEVLTESTLIALLGGVFGVIAARGVLGLAEELLSFELPLDPEIVAVGLVAAAISGLVAGVYPARKAGAIEVVSALRME